MEFRKYELSGIWGEIFGSPEPNGMWLIWGKEKHGKTTLALMLADYLSTITRVLFVSAEEGIGPNFKNACNRAGLSADSKLAIKPYITLEELEVELEKKRGPKVVVLDNMTIYQEDLKYNRLNTLTKKYGNVLFIWMAHEEDNKPYTSAARTCARLAKIKIRVQGLAAFVEGRCPGGNIVIDDEKAQVYWGNAIK